MTALEALASGLPLVASNVPPFNELLASDYGVMVNPKDETEVATVISGLLKDPSRRAEMGLAGRERVTDHFTWLNASQQYLQLLETCV